ncbi:hypothetical protein PM082_019287 [Marasmius tenuissimus]|nr:hypothetical protein PM082_019287 [Marasmius tenuissimus]
MIISHQRRVSNYSDGSAFQTRRSYGAIKVFAFWTLWAVLSGSDFKHMEDWGTPSLSERLSHLSSSCPVLRYQSGLGSNCFLPASFLIFRLQVIPLTSFHFVGRYAHKEVAPTVMKSSAEHDNLMEGGGSRPRVPLSFVGDG